MRTSVTPHAQAVRVAESARAPRHEPARRRDAAGPDRITSAELLGARAELIIVHDGREYRLRVTQNGKLILTA